MSKHSLFPLGIDLVEPSTSREEETFTASEVASGDDHMMVRGGVRCAGAHIIIDVYGGSRLNDLAHMEKTLVDCVEAAGATLLHIHLHHFDENSGISGVAVLAESHISVHSWPEHDYAAFDVFMCGETAPERCVEVIRGAFQPDRIAVSEILRGQRL